LLFGRSDGAEPLNLCPQIARADGVCVGHTGRIYITAIGFEHDAADAVVVDQRVQTLCLITADLVKVHAVEFGFRSLQPQLMFARLGLGEV